jgi:hypothetical protein
MFGCKGEEGSFLVRESSSSSGDFALSVYSAGEVHHVQIQRHDRDALFSVGKFFLETIREIKVLFSKTN